jgi:hypothetical protein
MPDEIITSKEIFILDHFLETDIFYRQKLNNIFIISSDSKGGRGSYINRETGHIHGYFKFTDNRGEYREWAILDAIVRLHSLECENKSKELLEKMCKPKERIIKTKPFLSERARRVLIDRYGIEP